MLKKENGVTLVALVITIIVLLILAGVTLAMVMGDSGIFTKANTAAGKTAASSARDAVRLAAMEVVTNKYDDNGESEGFADVDAAVSDINTRLTAVGEGYQIVADASKYKITLNNEDVKDENDAVVTVEVELDTSKKGIIVK